MIRQPFKAFALVVSTEERSIPRAMDAKAKHMLKAKQAETEDAIGMLNILNISRYNISK